MTEFSPQLDDTRTNLLLAELLYHFLLGVAARKTESGDARLLPFASFNSMDPKISSMSEAFARGPFNCATTMAEPILMANSENRVGTPSNISPQTSLVLRPPPYPVDHIDVFSSVHSNSPQCGSPASNSPRISHKSIPTPTNSELRQQLSQIAIQNNFKQNSGSNLTQNLAGIDMKKPSSFSVSSPSSRTMNMPPNVALRSASSLTSSSSSMSSVGSNDPRQFSRQPSFQNNFQPSSAGVGPSPRGLASSTANSLYTSASGSFNNNNRNGGLFVQNPHSANSNYSIMSNFEGVGEVHNFDESIDLANFDNHMNNQNYYGQQNFESSSGKEVNSFSSSNMSGYNNNSNSQSNGTMNGNSFHQSPLYSSNEFSSINSANSSNRQGDQSGSVYEY